MESAHHFSSKPDCNNTADVPFFILRSFFILRTALSAIRFVSERGVDEQGFQARSSQDLPS